MAVSTSYVDVKADGVQVVVQGFRGSEGLSLDPYVFIGVLSSDADEDGDPWVDIEIELTPENAHILSEEIRKHAEYANSAEEEK